MSMPIQMISQPMPRLKTLSVGLKGARFMMPFSSGSTASARPGKPSVTRLIHRICRGRSGSGMPKKGAINITKISPMLLESVYLMNLRMLSKMTRPSSTAATMVAKLSSSKIISAASLETSVPVIPMATPISARLSAGASLTPSPVMATISPFAWSELTMSSLCSGATRA